MITIAQDKLPQTFLSYIAFRSAFLDTLERTSWTLQFESLEDDQFGYLTEVPFLKAVPPHIQLDLLASTWAKHMSSRQFEATLLDEAIVYAVCELAARIADNESSLMDRFLSKGPLSVDVTVNPQLSSDLRDLHLKLSNEGDFLLIGQFSDIPPDEADRLKQKFNFDKSRADVMFEALSRWYLEDDFETRAQYLLTPREIARGEEVMRQKMTKTRLQS